MQIPIPIHGLSRGRFGSFRFFGIGRLKNQFGFWLGSFDLSKVLRTIFPVIIAPVRITPNRGFSFLGRMSEIKCGRDLLAF